MEEVDAILMWALSEKCNLNCRYCFNQERVHGEIKTVFINKLLKTLTDSKKTYLISLTGGGEPFLVKNFIELCENLTKDHYVSVITNLTSDKIEEFARKINPKRVDSIVASMHLEELYTHGLMDKFIFNLEILKKRGYNLIVTEVAYPGLIKDFEKYNKFINQINYKLEFYPFFGDYEKKHYPESYTNEELNFFGLKDNFKLNRVFQHNKLCNAGHNIVYVKPNGNINLCPRIPIKLGNIYKKIYFNDSLIKCPNKFCTCPLNDSDNAYMFDKAVNETRSSAPFKLNLQTRLLIYLDPKLGVLGKVIKKNSPKMYSLLKSIKNLRKN